MVAGGETQATRSAEESALKTGTEAARAIVLAYMRTHLRQELQLWPKRILSK